MGEALAAIALVKSSACFVTKREEHVKSRLAGKRVYYIHDPHTSRVGFIRNAFRAFCLVVYLRPRVVLSTGSGIAIPFCMLAKLFGARLIFIETGARVVSPSRTGKFMYRYADEFYVQWPRLLAQYPAARYEGRLL